MTTYQILVPLVVILLLALFTMTNQYTNLQSSFVVQWAPADESLPSPQSLTEKKNLTEIETEINPKLTKSTKATKQPTILPTSSTAEITRTTPYSYDARLEIDKRRDHLKLWCEERGLNPGFRSMSYRTGYVSKWGQSLGGVNFWTCFTPKCASSSFSVAVLAATGYITQKDYNDDIDLDKKWDNGRNKCPRTNPKCLHSFNEMPYDLRQMDPEKTDDPFTSVIFVREPMDRLVSAWKDKIHTNKTGKQWYYQKYTFSILRRYKSDLGADFAQKQIPAQIDEAWEDGFRVSFKMFVKWIAAGNKAADEHWTPASLLCGICDGNWQFIGHSEHFDEDIHIFAEMVKIKSDLFPASYDAVNSHAARFNQRTANRMTHEWYSDIDNPTLAKIREIYKTDYEAFSYTMPDWLENA